jgi:hypothetical protein
MPPQFARTFTCLTESRSTYVLVCKAPATSGSLASALPARTANPLRQSVDDGMVSLVPCCTGLMCARCARNRNTMRMPPETSTPVPQCLAAPNDICEKQCAYTLGVRVCACRTISCRTGNWSFELGQKKCRACRCRLAPVRIPCSTPSHCKSKDRTQRITPTIKRGSL